MTVSLSGTDVANKISAQFPDVVVESTTQVVIVKPDSLYRVAEFLKNSVEFFFDYINDMTATDYYDYFEVVLQLSSLSLNHKLTLKTRLFNREKPSLQSVSSLWHGAELMEREIFDLMGITFSGHPQMKRIFLWEGFDGYPLRKDYL